MDCIKKYQKKDVFCTNCESCGHSSKYCPQPIASYGIIMLNICIDESIKSELIKMFENVTVNMQDDTHTEITINDYEDIGLFAMFKNSFEILMVQRKHSLGFIEFVRGRYIVENVDNIIYLFKQMTHDEIKLIKESISFDDLWNYLWGPYVSNVTYYNDYQVSKEKYMKLKMANSSYLNLTFYVNQVIPDYKCGEWGFPKGRKNSCEINKACAIREFTEETNYKESEYILLPIEPIEELITGTNGINYKHVYYVAMLIGDNVPYLDQNNPHQINEIGGIDFFSYCDAIKIIRDYHKDKLRIINQLYMYIMNKLITFSKELFV